MPFLDKIRNDRKLIRKMTSTALGFSLALCAYIAIPDNSVQKADIIGPKSPVSLPAQNWAFDLSDNPTTTTTIPVEISTSHEPILQSTTTTTAYTTTTIRVSPVPTAAPVIVQPTDDIWWALALCEDGGRNRFFAPYSGYFHFLPTTWWNIGGPEGYPHEYDYETQKYWAIINQQLSGWGQWPDCARKLGLL